MASKHQCKNCEESIDDSFDYCPHCGQETTDILTVGVLFSNTIRNYFSIDARFYKSFIPLMTKPGVLARRFVDGKRQLYLHPAQFYLFVSIVFFFIFSFTIRQADDQVSQAIEIGFDKELSDMSPVLLDSVGVEAIDSVINGNKNVSQGLVGFQKGKLDSLIASGASEYEKILAMGMEEDAGVFSTKIYLQLLKLYEQKGGGILQTLYDTIPIAMFVLLPLFALLLKLLYWKRGTFAHHIVFSFYFFTFIFTTFCLLILANTIVNIPIWIDVIVFLSFMIYLMLALRHFYGSRWWGAFLKSSIISFVYMLIVLPFAMVGVIFVSFLMY